MKTTSPATLDSPRISTRTATRKRASCRPSATLSSSSRSTKAPIACSKGPTDGIAGIVAASRSIRRSGHEVDELGVNGRMRKSRCIILAGLDDQSRSVIESCLPNDQFEITQIDPESGNETLERVVLVVFTATDDVPQVRQLCASMRNRIGQSAAARVRRAVCVPDHPASARDGSSGSHHDPVRRQRVPREARSDGVGFLMARVEQDDAAVCDMPRKISKGAVSCQ